MHTEPTFYDYVKLHVWIELRSTEQNWTSSKKMLIFVFEMPILDLISLHAYFVSAYFCQQMAGDDQYFDYYWLLD